jgi:CheY-like chemotaxis protein
LIIEDDAAIRESLEAVLIEESYQVETANNGKTGIERLEGARENLPKLILLDLTMPVMTGTEFLAVQKAHSVWKSIPTIVFTAAGNRTKPDLADDYVRKPINLDDLLNVIEKHSR